MAKPRYYLTFLGEPADAHENEQKYYGQPEGVEIFEYLQAQLPSLGLQFEEVDGTGYSWFFVVRRDAMRYWVELSRPFKAFSRDEWLITTEPLPSFFQWFSKWAGRQPDQVHLGIKSILEATGRYHSFTTYIAGREGDSDWKAYPA